MKKIISYLLGLVLAATSFLAGSSDQSSAVETTNCLNNAEPWIAGVALNAAGQPSVGEIQMSSLGLRGDGAPTFSYPTSSTSSEQGYFELCPALMEDGNGGTYVPTVSSSTTIWLSQNIYNASGSSLVLNRITPNQELIDCLNAGGPCSKNLVDSNANLLNLVLVDAGNTQINTPFIISISEEHGIGNGNLGFSAPFVSSYTNSGKLNITGLPAGNYEIAAQPLDTDQFMSEHFYITINSDRSISWKTFDWKFTGQPTGSTHSLSANQALRLTPKVPNGKFYVAGNSQILTQDQFADFNRGESSFALMDRDGMSNNFTWAAECSNWENSDKTKCGMNYEIANTGAVLFNYPDGYYRFWSMPQMPASTLLLDSAFVVQLQAGNLTSAWREKQIYDSNNADGYSTSYEPIAIDVGGLKAVSFPTASTLAKTTQIDGESYDLAGVSIEAFNKPNPNSGFSLFVGSEYPRDNPEFVIPDMRNYGFTCDTSSNGSSPEFRIIVSPNWTASNYRDTSFALDCSVTGGAIAYQIYPLNGAGNPDTALGALDKLSLPLNKSELFGQVLDKFGLPTTKANVNVNAYDPITKTINNSSSENASSFLLSSWKDQFPGKFGFHSSTSRFYLVTAETWDSSRGAWTSVVIETVVNDQGKMTAVYRDGDRAHNLLDPGIGLTLQLREPNFKGISLLSNGKPNANTNANIAKWSDSANTYMYGFSPSYVGIDGSGIFQTYLEQGRYKVTPQTSTGSDVSPDYEIWVDETGATCKFANQASNSTLCSSEVLHWTLKMAEPNVVGTVTYGVSPVKKLSNSWFNLEKWNDLSGYWQGMNLSSNSNTDIDGNFGLLVKDPGHFRLRMSASNIQNNDGYVDTYRYFARDGSGKLCAETKSDNFDLAPSCSGLSQSTLNLSLTMERGNFSLDIRMPASNGQDLVPALYASVSLRDSTNDGMGGPSWNSWTNSGNSGTAYTNIPTSTATKYYEITVTPPWTSGEVMLSSRKFEICTKSNLIFTVVNRTCTDTQIDSVLIQLAEGNFQGKVLKPDGSAFASTYPAWINVQKWYDFSQDWSTPPSSPGSYWGWRGINNQMNVNSSGKFTGDLEPGLYKIRATSNVSMYSENSAIVKVASIGGENAWCTMAEDASSLDLADFNNSETAVEDLLADCTPLANQSHSLQLKLSVPNFSGTLIGPTIDGIPGGAVANTWANITEVTGLNPWDYRYLSGFNVNSGRFSAKLKLPQTGTKNYRIEFGQPYNSDFTRFSITVSCTSSGCTYNSNATNNIALAYPTPNIMGKVCGISSQTDPDTNNYSCVAIQNTSVNVEKWDSVTSNWQWQNIYSQVGRSGKFSLNLPEGRFRVRAYPSWDNPEGVQSTAIVDVDSNGTASIYSGDADASSANLLEIQLKSPNLVGTLKYKKDTIPTAMSFGSISAYFDCSQDVNPASCWSSDWSERSAWGSADKNGSFKLLLNRDGIWNLTAYSNFSKAAKAPVQLIANVSNGEIIDFKYSIDGVAVPLWVVDFDAIPANLKITISNSSQIRTVQFLDITSDSNGVLDSSLTSVTSGGSDNALSITLPAGKKYRVRILPTSRDARSATVETGTISSSLTTLPAISLG